jgi:hypothetical protein
MLSWSLVVMKREQYRTKFEDVMTDGISRFLSTERLRLLVTLQVKNNPSVERPPWAHVIESLVQPLQLHYVQSCAIVG